MQYRNSRIVKAGDVAISFHLDQRPPVVGIVSGLEDDPYSPSLRLASIPPTEPTCDPATCLHVEDAVALIVLAENAAAEETIMSEKIKVLKEHASVGVHAFGSGGTVSAMYVVETPEDAVKLKAAIEALVDPTLEPWWETEQKGSA